MLSPVSRRLHHALFAAGLCVFTACAPAPSGVSRATPTPPRGVSGVYNLATGEVGPGGGVVFYASPSPFRCGAEMQEECMYLEHAPDGWFDGRSDPRAAFLPSGVSLLEGVTSQALGAGWGNTSRLLDAAPVDSAPALARSYRGGGFTDWSLPSSQELNLLCRFVHGASPGGDFCESTPVFASGFAPDFYWGSYVPSPGLAWYQNFSSGGQSAVSQENTLRVRPVRAFGFSGAPDAPNNPARESATGPAQG